MRAESKKTKEKDGIAALLEACSGWILFYIRIVTHLISTARNR